ncbi:hypothetical protein HMPREF1317_1469 [Schaalia georgiae F0490]|uniref:Uncharacterized protein n=1 Tax=Schaalia georgiae F0490 TaxID=1125717 RepID=J0XS07_9ACTO|nr:hypothetical protein HMPREF1317_1469 [Schaalia georgiae F0490]
MLVRGAHRLWVFSSFVYSFVDVGWWWCDVVAVFVFRIAVTC